MPITEAYMDAGDFSVPMDTETPELMETVKRGGYLVATPQYLGDPRGFTDASLLAASRYVGIVTETIWTNGVLTLEGAHAGEWIMGDLGGIGWPCPVVSYSSDSLATVIALATGGGIMPVAFTIGTITSPFANYTGSHSGAESVKEVIKRVMDTLDTHYRITGGMTIDAGPTASNAIYKNDPELVFVRDGWGSDALWTGAPVSELESSVSIREWTSAFEPELYTINGTQIQRASIIVDPLAAPAAAEITATELRTDWAQTGAIVGDTIFVYDPGSGFVGNETIWFRGRALKPAKLRIAEFEWEPVDGMGFYYRPAGVVTSESWIDLTATTTTVPAGSVSSYIRTHELSFEAQGS